MFNVQHVVYDVADVHCGWCTQSCLRLVRIRFCPPWPGLSGPFSNLSPGNPPHPPPVSTDPWACIRPRHVLSPSAPISAWPDPACRPPQRRPLPPCFPQQPLPRSSIPVSTAAQSSPTVQQRLLVAAPSSPAAPQPPPAPSKPTSQRSGGSSAPILSAAQSWARRWSSAAPCWSTRS